MIIKKCVQRIQRAEAVAKFKDSVAKQLHFDKYAKATGTEKLKLFHVAICCQACVWRVFACQTFE